MSDIDGIRFTLPVRSFEDYKRAIPFLLWGSRVDEETGEMLPEKTVGKHRQDKQGRYSFTTITRMAAYKNLQLKVKEVRRQFYEGFTGNPVAFYLEVTGSIHKAYHGHNYGLFTFQQLQEQLQEIEQVLHIPLQSAIIQNIEVAMNLNPIVPACDITDHIHTHKGKHFYYYEPKEIGGYFSTARNNIKIYNKGIKEKLPVELLRIELHYKKMGIVNSYGIKTLADLTNRQKVMSLQKELHKAWADVVVFDLYAANNKDLPERDRQFLNEVMNRDYWQTLRTTCSRKTLHEKKERLRLLSEVYGKGIHRAIAKQMAEHWPSLFKEVTFVPGGGAITEKKKCNECTIKIKSTNVTPVKRHCVSCGRDITAQKPGSRFCSEQLYGKEAKKCRNKNSNPRNNLCRKLKTIESRGVLFDIRPHIRQPQASTYEFNVYPK